MLVDLKIPVTKTVLYGTDIEKIANKIYLTITASPSG